MLTLLDVASLLPIRVMHGPNSTIAPNLNNWTNNCAESEQMDQQLRRI
jgi:hypothetical protein